MRTRRQQLLAQEVNNRGRKIAVALRSQQNCTVHAGRRKKPMISRQASSLTKRLAQFFQRHIKIQCREVKTGTQQGSLNIVGVEVVVQSKHPINRSLPCEVSDDAGLPEPLGPAIIRSRLPGTAFTC
jgi:hypothetical protein